MDLDPRSLAKVVTKPSVVSRRLHPGALSFVSAGRMQVRGLSLRVYADGQMKVSTRANMEKGGDNMTIGRHHGHEEKTGTSSRPARPGLLTQNMCALDRDPLHI